MSGSRGKPSGPCGGRTTPRSALNSFNKAIYEVAGLGPDTAPVLQDCLALVRLQPFGNFVAIEVFGGLVEEGEQYEGDEAGIEVFLEFAGVAFVRAVGVYRMLLVDFAPLCPGCAEN